MPTVAKAGAVVETMTAVAAAKEAACARVEKVCTRGAIDRALRPVSSHRRHPPVRSINRRTPAIDAMRRIDPRSIAGNLELDERCATRREVARSARVDRIGVNRPLRSVVVRGRGRRARCAEG